MAELCDQCIETLFRGLQENPKTYRVLGELAEEDLSLAELMKRTKLSIFHCRQAVYQLIGARMVGVAFNKKYRLSENGRRLHKLLHSGVNYSRLKS